MFKNLFKKNKKGLKREEPKRNIRVTNYQGIQIHDADDEEAILNTIDRAFVKHHADFYEHF